MTISLLTTEALKERISNSELGREWIDDSLLLEDKWSTSLLGYSDDDIKIWRRQTISFEGYKLPWLKFLAKLTIKAAARELHTLQNLVAHYMILFQLDKFLATQGYAQPKDLTGSLLLQFLAESSTSRRRSLLVYATRLWAEEGWLCTDFVPPVYRRPTPKVEVIPEEVLYQFISISIYFLHR